MTEPYRIRSAEIWTRARDDYLAGMTAEAVCRRHDLGLSIFRRRARKHGWRRIDQDDTAPDPTDLSIYDSYSPEDEIQTARLRYIQALDQGRATEAVRWRRLWQELREETDAFDKEFFVGMTRAQIAARLETYRREQDEEDANCLIAEPEDDTPLAPAEAENVHDVHSNFDSAQFPPAETTPLSRAERRRREREARRQTGGQKMNASNTPPTRPPDGSRPGKALPLEGGGLGGGGGRVFEAGP